MKTIIIAITLVLSSLSAAMAGKNDIPQGTTSKLGDAPYIRIEKKQPKKQQSAKTQRWFKTRREGVPNRISNRNTINR